MITYKPKHLKQTITRLLSVDLLLRRRVVMKTGGKPEDCCSICMRKWVVRRRRNTRNQWTDVDVLFR